MRKLLTAIVLGLSALSPTAKAADGGLAVWDSKGTQIGMWSYDEVLRHKFSDGVWREIGFWRQGLIPQVTFVYQSSNCTGQRYFYWGYSNTDTQVMPMTYFEYSASPGSPTSFGRNIWGNSISASVVVGNYGSAWQDTGPDGQAQCYSNINAGNVYLMPATQLDTTSKGFHPPFCTDTTSMKCAAAAGEKMLYINP